MEMCAPVAARSRGRRVLPAALLAAGWLLAGLAAPAHAQSSRFGGEVALASQLVDQGIAITADEPVLQGAVSWMAPGGWSFGVAGGVEARSPGTPVFTLARASHAWTPSADWLVQASLLYYDYRSRGRAAAPDRMHANLYFTWRDTLTFGVSAIHPAGDHPRRVLGAADAEIGWPLGRHFTLSAGAGVAQALVVRGYHYRYERVEGYRYGNLGLAWNEGPWRLQVDRTANSLGARGAYSGAGTPSDWVATLAWSF
jgi:uncharacterized protein (TIGR02001 family)